VGGWSGWLEVGWLEVYRSGLPKGVFVSDSLRFGGRLFDFLKSVLCELLWLIHTLGGLSFNLFSWHGSRQDLTLSPLAGFTGMEKFSSFL
jgi:hypothetical protein